MSEKLQGSTEDFFRDILRENLSGPRETNVAVLAVGGSPGSGVTTTCKEMAKIIQEQTTIPVHVFSSSGESHRLTQEMTGIRKTEVRRDPQSIREVDRRLALKVLSPDSAHSIVIADGRFTPLVTKGLQQAGRHYPIALPFKSLGIHLEADDQTRFARLYLAARNEGGRMPSVDLVQDATQQNELREMNALWEAYPNLVGKNPSNIDFQLNGERVYDLHWDTDRYTNKVTELANRILINPQVSELLAIARR